MSHPTNWIQRFLAAALAVLLASATVPAQAAETVTYIHWDALGSPVAATDEDGNVVWREAYRPFGQRINNESAAGSHSRWYTGHPQDADTGLVYAGARYYDPVIGRFLAIDPVGVQAGNLHSFNRYAYANNNPYGYIDPDGREAQSVLGDVPTNPIPGMGTWITAGVIASPLGIGLALSRTAVAVGTDLALGEVGFSGGVAGAGATAASGLSKVTRGTIPRNKSLSTIREAGPDETFVRFESADVRFSKVTTQGGLKPGTFAAPRSELPVPLSQRATRFNLPDPQIPRTRQLDIQAPGDLIIGPRPVSGGTGNEVLFPFGTKPGTVK